MARIIQGRVEDGDTITAADLNTRFSAYNQTNLNQFNHRDAAIDLPQLSDTDFMGTYLQEITIGKSDVYHAAPVTIAGQTVMPATAYVIGDGTNPTPMSFGPLGITVATDDILRVYWNLSVNPTYTGTPWLGSGTISNYAFPNGLGSTLVQTGTGCWILYLEWDVTSNALTNWVSVPNQGDYSTNFTGSLYGSRLENSMSAVPIPAWVERAESADSGEVPSTVVHRIGWRGVSGTWYYPKTSGSQTIYGLRVVARGVMNSYKNSNINYLCHDIVSSSTASLQYTGGKLSVIMHTMG